MRILSKKDLRVGTTTEVKRPGVFDTKEPVSIGYLGPQSYYTATEEDENDKKRRKE